MTTSTKLSIVLTVYNMESCLEACLDSILAQSYTNFELICIDDGSTDASPAILERYAANDERVLVFTQENKGPADARNAGIERAQGEYLMLLDSDDIFVPSFFEKMIERAAKTDSDVVLCRSCEYDDQSGEEIPAEWILRKDLLPDADSFTPAELKGCLFAAIMGWPWDKLYRTSHIREYKLRFPPLPNSEDLVFVYLALAKAQRLSVVDEVLIKHRINRGSSVSNSRIKHPSSFYESIVLLKRELEKDSASYLDYKWGLLNWALHHTFWNIQTLPEGEARSSLVTALFSGGFPELELESHPLEYYALYPDIGFRFEELLAEYEGRPYRRSLWSKMEAASRLMDKDGFSAVVRRMKDR
ncbi:MAG: glycosyltransferase family 2 protein [Raoultibacter sp.]|jgi:glycosyltransferase involved in cell wall biosynthesis